MPKSVNVTDRITGRTAIAAYTAEQNAHAEEQRTLRAKAYPKYWLYYKGEQYDKENNSTRVAMGIDSDKRMPEHTRKHSYTGAIEEGIDFITDQLVENLSIEVKSQNEIKTQTPDDTPPAEQEIFLRVWEESDMDLNAPDLTREALVSAESYILLKWDEAANIVRMIPYDAESVDPIYSQDNYKKMLSCNIWQTKFSAEQNREVKYREQYVLGPTSEGYSECVYLKFDDINPEPIEARLLNIPFIPIIHIRAIRKRVRESFGESMVARLIPDADRYNAVNQLEYSISRYNSTSHLAIFGNESNIKPENLNLGGEANDFWAFPMSTDVKPVMLPTDTTMITNQKETIETQMYKKMGLQRMDLIDFAGLGAPSGYALEIINRKSDGVFARIQKELTKSYIEVFDKTMDMQAIMESGKPWWAIDPLKVYPNRTVKYTFGSLFVADREQIRADFVAGVISQKHALKMQGYTEAEALEIMDQQDEERQAAGAIEMEGMAGLIKTAKTPPAVEPDTTNEPDVKA